MNFQNSMIGLSSSMFRATDSRAYLRDVAILVPASWTDKGYEAATWESYHLAGIRVDVANPLYGDRPYTEEGMTNPGCGVGWEYTHLTPGYIASFRGGSDSPGNTTPLACVCVCAPCDKLHVCLVYIG